PTNNDATARHSTAAAVTPRATAAARDFSRATKSALERTLEVVEHAVHGGDAAERQVPLLGVDVHDLARARGGGAVHQRVVEDGGSGLTLGADCGVAVEHNEQVGVGVGDELERDRVAVRVDVDLFRC